MRYRISKTVTVDKLAIFHLTGAPHSHTALSMYLILKEDFDYYRKKSVMRVQYLHKLLIYLGQGFNTVPFILLASIILPEIMECILKFLFVLVYNKG